MGGNYPAVVETLIGELKQLPGIGRRGAERMALELLSWDADRLSALGGLIADLPRSVVPCPECGALAEAGHKCSICSAPGRDASRLCVVESMPQLFAIESSGHFRGRYLVLGGRLSPVQAENGENLNLDLLLARVRSGEVKEVILALSSDVEGRATAFYLADLLKDTPVRVTRPALGLPAGADLSFADAATIGAAFSGRNDLE